MTERKKTILVVDDSVFVTQFLAEFLRHEGFVAIEQNDPVQALERIRQGGIDLVISDVMMPQMDGFTLVKRIRNRPEGRNLPVIFLSAKDRREGKPRSMLVGAVDYLSKPVEAAELLAKVKEVLAAPQAAESEDKELGGDTQRRILDELGLDRKKKPK